MRSPESTRSYSTLILGRRLLKGAAGFDAALRSVHRLSLRQGAGDGPALRSRAEDARGELFFTLTYDDEHVPADYSVKLRDWQLFLKRTRKRARGQGSALRRRREYGELGLRPHYHGLFFNYDFPDKKLLRKRNGHPVYSSELLSELWENKGSTELGSVTHASAAYVARYSMKEGDRQEGR